MIEKDDVILVDGVGYTVAELEADPVLAARAIYWWRGRQQARVETIGLFETEAQARRSNGGKKAAESIKQRLTRSRKRKRWHIAVDDILAKNHKNLSDREIARRIIERKLSENLSHETIRKFVAGRRKALGFG